MKIRLPWRRLAWLTVALLPVLSGGSLTLGHSIGFIYVGSSAVAALAFLVGRMSAR